MTRLVSRAMLIAGAAFLSAIFQVLAQEGNQSPVELNQKLPEFRTARQNWVAALGLLLYKTDIPYLFELDTLTYRDMSARDKLGLFTGPKERTEKWFTAFKVDLRNVTIEQAMKEILKDQPRYTYEVVEDGRCLHVFPRGIQEHRDWPLNRTVTEFSIEHQQTNTKWYRGVFGPFLLRYKVHIGEFDSINFSKRLMPRTFKNVTLRELLVQLSVMCRMQWIVEPFPEEEIKFRETYNKEYYERGYDIGRPGSNDWYQIHFFFLEDQPPTGSVQGKLRTPTSHRSIPLCVHTRLPRGRPRPLARLIRCCEDAQRSIRCASWIRTGSR